MIDANGLRSWIGPSFPCMIQDFFFGGGGKDSLKGKREDSHSLFAPPTSGLHTTPLKVRTGKLGTLQGITHSGSLQIEKHRGI